MWRLLGLLLYETLRLACTWDTASYVRRLWLGSMRINVVITKVFQAAAARRLGRALDAGWDIDRVPISADEVATPDIPELELTGVLGAGMVAVVFGGVVRATGARVIVKVKRRGIERRIVDGLRDARWLLALAHRLPGMRQYALDTVHGEVRELLTGQLDFVQEVRNQLEFRAVYAAAVAAGSASAAAIVVPAVHERWCTSDMIVMEQLASAGRAPRDRAIAAEVLAEAVALALVRGLMHADLHLGNVIFMADDRVGVLDFGLVIRLTPRELASYLDIIGAAVRKCYGEAATMAARTFLAPAERFAALSDAQRMSITNAMADVYETAVTEQQSVSVAHVFTVAALVRPHGLHIAPIFYKTMMSQAAGDLLLKQLSPNPAELFLRFFVRATMQAKVAEAEAADRKSVV